MLLRAGGSPFDGSGGSLEMPRHRELTAKI